MTVRPFASSPNSQEFESRSKHPSRGTKKKAKYAFDPVQRTWVRDPDANVPLPLTRSAERMGNLKRRKIRLSHGNVP